MHKLVTFHPAQVAKGAIADIKHLSDYPTIESETAEMLPPEVEPAVAKNAVRFGVDLAQQLNPPVMHVIYHNEKPVTLIVGQDLFNNQPMHIDVRGMSPAEVSKLANNHLDMIRKVNSMLERTPEEYRERISMNTRGLRSTLLLACAQSDIERSLYQPVLYPPELAMRTFSNSVLTAALAQMGERMTAYGMQQLAGTFVPAFYEEMHQGAGTLPENASRALTLAATRMLMRDLPAGDEAVLSQMIRTMNSKRNHGVVDAMWNQRQDNLWRLWQSPMNVMPQRHQATFKTAFVQLMNDYLGDHDFPGDQSMIWTAGYEAAYRAGEAALRVDERQVTYEYLNLQRYCIDRLNELREAENDKDAAHRERERGYQPYDDPETVECEPEDIEIQ